MGSVRVSSQLQEGTTTTTMAARPLSYPPSSNGVTAGAPSLGNGGFDGRHPLLERHVAAGGRDSFGACAQRSGAAARSSDAGRTRRWDRPTAFALRLARWCAYRQPGATCNHRTPTRVHSARPPSLARGLSAARYAGLCPVSAQAALVAALSAARKNGLSPVSRVAVRGDAAARTAACAVTASPPIGGARQPHTARHGERAAAPLQGANGRPRLPRGHMVAPRRAHLEPG